jgi:hypothetical protein
MACTEVELAQRIIDGVTGLIQAEEQLRSEKQESANLGAHAVPQVATLIIPPPPSIPPPPMDWQPGILGVNSNADQREREGIDTPVWVKTSSSSQNGGGGEENSATVRPPITHRPSPITHRIPLVSPQYLQVLTVISHQLPSQFAVLIAHSSDKSDGHALEIHMNPDVHEP